MVNIGIVGIGQIAEDYISIFAKGSIKDGKISALASRNQEHLDQIISKYHLEGVSKFKTIEDMLDSNLVDAVMITTPHTLHTEMATKVLAKGKHVLVDKPLGIKAGEVDKLADLAKMNPNLQAGVIFNRRSSELYQRVHSLVKSKELGELRRSIWQITNLYRTYAYYKSGSWRGRFKTEGGGVLMNQAIHQLDLLLWIAGMPEKVMARTKEGFHRPVFTENDVSLYMDYENGASGQFIASAHECPGTNRLELSFDKGQLIIEDDSKLTIRRLEQKEEDFAKQTLTYFDKVPYQEEKENYDFKLNTVEQAVIINNFIDAILGRVNLLCPFEEGRNTVRVVNAAYLSSWRKEEVALDFDQEEYETALKGKIEIEENMKAKQDVL
ncbi:MAG: Gfo/Idh/MocA family oxidoreductase [Clostridiaceae bacterium]